jgi:hypothetical protein
MNFGWGEGGVQGQEVQATELGPCYTKATGSQMLREATGSSLPSVARDNCMLIVAKPLILYVIAKGFNILINAEW